MGCCGNSHTAMSTMDCCKKDEGKTAMNNTGNKDCCKKSQQ
jgi:hypothetical protein